LVRDLHKNLQRKASASAARAVQFGFGGRKTAGAYSFARLDLRLDVVKARAAEKDSVHVELIA
jgi:hypothetical protein